MNKILKFIISVLVYGLILVSTIIISLIMFYSRELPDYNVLASYFPPTVSKIYADDGAAIMEQYAEEYRIFAPIDTIPKHVINAFLAAEDANFYSHPGIDHRGLSRALIQNIINYGSGRSLVGGSTITQQVVKNFLLSDEKSIKRKVQEAILAFRLTNEISKDRILELYLNQIFLGNHSYGIKAAALAYFDKELKELSIAEAALLAALPKAPSKFNPLADYNRALARRNWVLEQMYEHNFISLQQLQEAKTEPVSVTHYQNDNTPEANYFSEEVRQIIVEEYGEHRLYNDGLQIFTSCNLEMQRIAQKALQNQIIAFDQQSGYRGPLAHIAFDDNWPKALINERDKIKALPDNWQIVVISKVSNKELKVSNISGEEFTISASSLQWAKKPITTIFSPGDIVYIEPQSHNQANLRQIPEVNGAVVIMDPHSGKIHALVGGFSYQLSKFNRASQAIRQPGSAFKPFVYLTALEQNLLPTMILEDSPISISQGRNLPLWQPKNFSNKFLGPVTMRTALEKSLNIPTIRLAQKVGIKNISDLALKLGIYDSPIEDLSSALGALDTTLLRLTTAYAIIANGGTKIEPILIERIASHDGTTLYNENISLGDPLISPSSAYQLTSILSGATKRGTAKKLANTPLTLAGKTGTTNDSKDAWFVGYTPDLVIGIFIGYDQPKSLGHKTTGGTLALPVFIEIIQQLQPRLVAKEFVQPDDIELHHITLEESNNKQVIVESFKTGQFQPITEPHTDVENIDQELELEINKLIDAEGNNARSDSD